MVLAQLLIWVGRPGAAKGGTMFCSAGMVGAEGHRSQGGKQCGQGMGDFGVEAPGSQAPLREDTPGGLREQREEVSGTRSCRVHISRDPSGGSMAGGVPLVPIMTDSWHLYFRAGWKART